jgi:hypothetical protein
MEFDQRRGVGFWAQRAKLEVLTMSAAEQTASQSKIRCEGLTGTHGGIIGAVSAIGLHRAGNDGRLSVAARFARVEGKYPAHKYQVKEICEMGHVDRKATLFAQWNTLTFPMKPLCNVGD